MQVERELQVSAEEFFNQVLYSVQQDIYTATRKSVDVNAIPAGFTYEKGINNKFGKASKTKIKIVELRVPFVYKAEFTSQYGVNFVAYRVTEIEPKRIKVTYEEGFKGATLGKNVNAKFMQIFYTMNSKKRVNRLLSSIETYIVQNRK